MEKMHHIGTMRTKMDDCQFVCIAQSEYYRILHQGEENTRKLEENGRVVLVTEHRVLDGGTRRGHVVIRGAPERLLAQLLDENLLDPGYIEDFLLTYRTFVDSPAEITRQMLDWFQDEKLRDRVTRVVLLWVNNHFTDFETDPDMMEFLEDFEQMLEDCKKFAQMRLLNIACATKARTRSITLARSNREEPLQFQIVGGYETGFDVFVSKVERGSKAYEVGLKRGDQILEVNGQSFINISHNKALDLFKKSTHLQISVRSNLMGLKEMVTNPNRTRVRPHRKSLVSDRSLLAGANGVSDDLGELCSAAGQPATSGVIPTNLSNPLNEMVYDLVDTQNCSSLSDKSSDGSTSSKKGFMTLGNRTKLKKALAKIISKNASIDVGSVAHDDAVFNGCCAGTSCGAAGTTGKSALYHSHSNPDLSSTMLYCDSSGGDVASTAECGQRLLDFPEHVLKVYRADQTSKFLLVHRETTAREVVMLSLREFGLTDSSSLYSLCEVTVGEGGLIKQRRLPDQLNDLAERMELRSRYYLKNNSSQEPLVADSLAGELLRESHVSFLQLNSSEVATQLTLEDFKIFRQIEPTEYVDDLFEVTNSRYGAPMLSKFAELVNREMFWVVTQVVSETNIVRRMRTVKQFIKLARNFREYRNFNSMFAILSGLGHGAVARLKATWDKLPGKYHKIFQDMQELMDPSRNMCRYRTLVTRLHPPLIPFYPVVRKDLTFIHYGNDTVVDQLVNFEKLRMVSKEVRSLMNMCSQPYTFPSSTSAAYLAQQHQQQSGLESSVSSSSVGLALGIAGVGSGPPNRHRPSRKKSSAGPNPKKMFEEAQMVRRVKAYFSGLKVVTDEDRLHELSMLCEPAQSQQSTGGAGTPTNQGGSLGGASPREGCGPSGSAPPHPRRRHPSPTLSTTSSTSLASSASEGKKSLGPKFGTDSPQAMRKLLALSEGVPKVRGTSGRNASAVPTGHTASSVSPSPSSMRKGSAESTLPFLVRGGSDSFAHHKHGNSASAAALGLMALSMAHHGVGGNSVLHHHQPQHHNLHLSRESSSVTSLRRDHTSVCSMTSIDSGVGPSTCSSINSHLDVAGADSGSSYSHQQNHQYHHHHHHHQYHSSVSAVPVNGQQHLHHQPQQQASLAINRSDSGNCNGEHPPVSSGSDGVQRGFNIAHSSGYQTIGHHHNPARFFGASSTVAHAGASALIVSSGQASRQRTPPFPHAIAVLPPLPPNHHQFSNAVTTGSITVDSKQPHSFRHSKHISVTDSNPATVIVNESDGTMVASSQTAVNSSSSSDATGGIRLNVASGLSTTGNRGRSAKPMAPPLPPPDRIGRPMVLPSTMLPRSRSHEGMASIPGSSATALLQPTAVPIASQPEISATSAAGNGQVYYQLGNEEEDTQVSAV